MTPDFLTHIRTLPGSCSESMRESHWVTWQAAQQALIAESGAPVLITTLRADGARRTTEVAT